MNHSSSFSDFLSRVAQLSKRIEAEEATIVECLLRYETYETAKDEVERSISTLNGMEQELSSQRPLSKQLTMSTFFPLNLPLYSLVLFAIAPGAYSRTVYVRSPQLAYDVLKDLLTILDLDTYFPSINLVTCSRTEFVQSFASNSDVVLFTGQYGNARYIEKRCKDALFIYNGSGVNPAIIFEDAPMAKTAKKLFEMRTYNSGQDCAGTDVIFVHESRSEELIKCLIKHINQAKYGSYGNKVTTIGPILRKQYISELEEYLHKNSIHVVHAGSLDQETGLIRPYILSRPLEKDDGDYHEFFASIFNLVTFKDPADIKDVLLRPQLSDFGMYASYFGTDTVGINPGTTILLDNKIINDVEQGNLAYGGYGSRANYIAHGKKRVAKPVLINEEIYSFYNNIEATLM